MSQNIILETSTGKLICPDCGQDMHEERYERPWGNYSTWTCKTSDCLLNSVTLGKDQWTSTDLEEYRAMNRKYMVKR